MTVLPRLPHLLAPVLALIAVPAAAQSQADLSAIEREVAAFAGVPSGALVPLDRRLRLAPCAAALSLGWYGAARDKVEVRCPVPGGWRLFVPVTSASAQAGASLVAKGDAVSIVVRDEGFAVAQPGEALEAGGQGAWIKVRPLRPGAPVLRARVLRPGQVGIELP